MRIFAQMLIPVCIFLVLSYLLFARSSGKFSRSNVEQPDPHEALSARTIIGILLISAMATGAAIFAAQSLLE